MRCLKILMAGEGYPMLATHDPTLIAIGRTVAQNLDRSSDTFEFQMLYGIRPGEQQRLAGLGHRMRVYVPYGTGLVRLPRPPAGRAAGQPRLLRPQPDHQELGTASGKLAARDGRGAPRRRGQSQSTYGASRA